MANPLVLQIKVDDKGNPVLVDMQSNIRKVDKHSSNLGKTMAKVFASGLVIQAMYSFKNAIYNAGKEVMEFNKIFKQVEGVTGTTGKALNDLKLKTLDISNTTEHSATAIAMATLNIAKMGFTTKEALDSIPHIANLATASIVDLDTASSVAVQTMKSFGLGANEMERIVNVMHGAISKTAIDFMDFSEAMKYVAPVAKTMNIGLEETAAMIGILGNVGIKGSLGGTSLKNMFLNIMKPSENIKKVLEGLNEEGLTFTKILQALHEQKIPIQDFLATFDKRAVSGSLALSRLTEEIDNLKKELGNISASDAANVIRDAWIPQLLILKNTFVNTFIVMGEILDQTNLGVSIQDITNRFIELQIWMRENPKQVEDFAKSIAFLSYQIAQLVASGFEIIVKNLDLLVRVGKVFILLKLFKHFDLLKASIISTANMSVIASPRIVGALTGINAAIPLIGQATVVIYALGEAFKYVTNRAFEAERAIISATWSSNIVDVQKQIKAAEDFLKEYSKIDMQGAGTPWGKMNIETGNEDELIEKYSRIYNFKKEFFEQAKNFGEDFVKSLKNKLGNAEAEAEKTKKILDGLFTVPKALDTGSAKDSAHTTMMAYYEEALRVQKEMSGLLKLGFKKDFVSQAYAPQLQGIQAAFPEMDPTFAPSLPKVINLDYNWRSRQLLRDPTLSAQLAVKLEFYEKDRIAAKKNTDEMKKDFLKFVENTQKISEGDAGWLTDYREEQKKLYKEYCWEQFDAYAEAAQIGIDTVQMIQDAELEKIKEKHQIQLNMFDERAKKDIDLVQNNIYKKQILERGLQREREKLINDQEKAEKGLAQKRRTWALIEAAINTAVGVTQVFRSVGPPASFILAAIVAAAGIAQIALIASQKEFFGGGYTGDGDPKDEAGKVHKREYVISHNKLTALGGKDNVEKMIDSHLNISGAKYTNVYIDTFIGQRDYERGLYKRLQMESTKW